MANEDNFNSIGEILGSTLNDGAEYSIVSRYAVFFSFWGDIVGSKFSSTSKPYLVKEGNLYVSCANSFVVQELMMFKGDILKKIIPYANGVNLDIKDIVFSYKNWESANSDYNFDDEENYEINPNDIVIDGDTENKILNITDKLSFLNDSQKNKLYLDILNNIKIMKNKEKF